MERCQASKDVVLTNWNNWANCTKVVNLKENSNYQFESFLIILNLLANNCLFEEKLISSSSELEKFEQN